MFRPQAPKRSEWGSFSRYSENPLSITYGVSLLLKVRRGIILANFTQSARDSIYTLAPLSPSLTAYCVSYLGTCLSLLLQSSARRKLE